MSNDGNNYFLQVELMSYNFQDFGQIKGYVNRSNGVTYPFKPADYIALRNQKYKYGIDNTKNGLLRIDPYPQTDFASLFGNIPS